MSSDNYDFSTKGVARYYDVSTRYYRLLWHGKSLGIHFGYYDPDIKTQEEAIVRTNDTLARMADIKSTDKVLDAGCGVGGSSIWIAKNIGANVTGITISPKQVIKANKYKNREGVSDKCEFVVGDFNEMDFADNTFGVVWGIEALCYGLDKNRMLKELYRVLKPGGRIIVSDWYKGKENLTAEEQRIADKFVHNFMVESWQTGDQFREELKRVGFKDIKYEDHTKDIKKNLEYGMPKAKKLTLAVKVLPRISGHFKEVAKTYNAVVSGEEAYEKGLWHLQAIVATKPE